jgi:alcohol dehydrogenase
VTAATGIDAMVHAIEAYTSQHKKNPISDMYACQALYLLVGNIERVIADGRDSEARQAMLLGSLMAGQAFSNAPVAAVHALAYPLGGFYHIPHGLSNALVLPAVLRFNASHAQQAYAELARVILPVEKHHDDDSLMVENFIQALEELVAACGLPARLRDVAIQHASCTQIPEHDLPMLAKAAMQQTRLLVNNPRNVSEADALAIYQASY